MDEEKLVALEREIMQAGASEVAPASVRRRALATLGLLVVAPPAAAATAGTTAVGHAAWWQSWLAKLGIIVGLGGAAVGGVALGQDANAPVAASSTQAVAAPSKANGVWSQLAIRSSLTSMAPQHDAPDAPSVSPASPDLRVVREAVGQAPARPVSRPSTEARQRPMTAPDAKSLREEITLLDRARAALRGGDSAAAISATDVYFSRFPRGELREEASVVRAQALRAQQPAQ